MLSLTPRTKEKLFDVAGGIGLGLIVIAAIAWGVLVCFMSEVPIS